MPNVGVDHGQRWAKNGQAWVKYGQSWVENSQAWVNYSQRWVGCGLVFSLAVPQNLFSRAKMYGFFMFINKEYKNKRI